MRRRPHLRWRSWLPGPTPSWSGPFLQTGPELRPTRTDAGNLVARRRKASSFPLPSTACASAFSNGAALCIRWASCAPSPSRSLPVGSAWTWTPPSGTPPREGPAYLPMQPALGFRGGSIPHGRGRGLRRCPNNEDHPRESASSASFRWEWRSTALELVPVRGFLEHSTGLTHCAKRRRPHRGWRSQPLPPLVRSRAGPVSRLSLPLLPLTADLLCKRS